MKRILANLDPDPFESFVVGSYNLENCLPPCVGRRGYELQLRGASDNGRELFQRGRWRQVIMSKPGEFMRRGIEKRVSC